MPRPPHKMLQRVLAHLKSDEKEHFAEAKKDKVLGKEISKKSVKKPLKVEEKGRGTFPKSEYQPMPKAKKKIRKSK